MVLDWLVSHCFFPIIAVQVSQTHYLKDQMSQHIHPHQLRGSLRNRVRNVKGQAMPNMTAVQVNRAGGEFELVERPLPEPAANQVRIKVDACGICHSDAMVKEG